ncbi:MAG: hypothetical protein ACYDGO_04540 [Smithellaceae bacterium]
MTPVLCHRLVNPYSKIAIGFFVVLTLVVLTAGAAFYYDALLVLIILSFDGAVYEFVKFVIAQKAGLKPA